MKPNYRPFDAGRELPGISIQFWDRLFGIFSVPAHGNEWYQKFMYAGGDDSVLKVLGGNDLARGVNAGPDSTRAWHTQHFGPPEKFGYKHFIPMFKAEHFHVGGAPQEGGRAIRNAGRSAPQGGPAGSVGSMSLVGGEQQRFQQDASGLVVQLQGAPKAHEAFVLKITGPKTNADTYTNSGNPPCECGRPE